LKIRNGDVDDVDDVVDVVDVVDTLKHQTSNIKHQCEREDHINTTPKVHWWFFETRDVIHQTSNESASTRSFFGSEL
jgi:hypothetical protein